MAEYIVEKKQTSGGWTWAEQKGKLIRCKDCKHREYGYCNLHLSFCYTTADMDYCSRAEREETVTMTTGRAKAKNVAEGKKAYTADTSVLKVSVDAEPVKHGKWLFIRMDENGNGLYECSVCHKGETHDPQIKVNYCWNCGAKMESEEE